MEIIAGLDYAWAGNIKKTEIYPMDVVAYEESNELKKENDDSLFYFSIPL